jgi:hypothetical protein
MLGFAFSPAATFFEATEFAVPFGGVFADCSQKMSF